ncbi:MAG: hypothetical protein GXO09_03065 [Crenarchaeota archaeon]|nr:hypothetical protein [Thermoproteota archaeon]
MWSGGLGFRRACRGEWFNLRRRLLDRLTQDMSKGLVDPDIAEFLARINKEWWIVTSSSCSGRIVVLAAREPWDKESGRIVARSHSPIDQAWLADALREAEYTGLPCVWVSAQPPVLTLYVCGEENALRVVDAAIDAGFKYACYRPSRRARNAYYVIIKGSERIDVPVKLWGRQIALVDVITLTNVLNKYLERGKERLEKLKTKLLELVS